MRRFSEIPKEIISLRSVANRRGMAYGIWKKK